MTVSKLGSILGPALSRRRRGHLHGLGQRKALLEADEAQPSGAADFDPALKASILPHVVQWSVFTQIDSADFAHLIHAGSGETMSPSCVGRMRPIRGLCAYKM